jgi:hypothetical protein
MRLVRKSARNVEQLLPRVLDMLMDKEVFWIRALSHQFWPPNGEAASECGVDLSGTLSIRCGEVACRFFESSESVLHMAPLWLVRVLVLGVSS